ncbi:unnamed protein product [Dibothriocephalus latus]|uniref:Mitoferrin-1 n=1 Tax=Dibothriocephalus latus TaxID=60516 RepID=A0A3P6V104_DIBLA|nr:unnamed protein product [Dibothriocephalus latus]
MCEWGLKDTVDYESLPEGVSPAVHMLAGASAGFMEHSIMYPVDCVKTRLQCIRPSGGQRYLSQLKKRLTSPTESNHLLHAFSGASATLVHDAIMTPTDAVKQRLQMFNSPYHTSWDCVVRVLRTEGVSALYRAYFTQLWTNIPFQSCHFMVYEFLQDKLNPSRTYLPWSHIVCGGLAGSVAAAITTPMDVCKTILNTQLIRGLLSAGHFVIKTHGFRGLVLGLNARVVATLPGTAISWSVYEYFKWALIHSSDRPSIPVHPTIPSSVSMESQPPGSF